MKYLSLGEEIDYEGGVGCLTNSKNDETLITLIDAAGPNIQIQAGGGISGHPLGVRAGAKAMVQAVDAALRDISAKEYSKDHRELKIALEKWCGE